MHRVRDRAVSTALRGRRRRSVVAVVGALALLAGVTGVAPVAASSAAPDAQDRTLVAALVTNVATFRAIDTATFGASEGRVLHSCRPLAEDVRAHAKNIGSAFASVLTASFDLSIPLLIELADANDAKLLALESQLEGMHPHAALFARWRTDELRALRLLVAFDSHQAPVDPCTAATYMVRLDALTKAQQAAAVLSFRTEIGISIAQFGALAPKVFSNSYPATLLTAIEPRMAAFFIAAGASSSDAKVLSSSE